MMEELSFEVVVRRKVPYVTSFLFNLLCIFVLFFVIVDVFFLPARHASDEMKVAYFILVVPSVVKSALYISGIGFLVVLPLYLLARRYKKASLTFLDNNIVISGDKINIDIPVAALRHVYCMDSHWPSGEPKYKLTIYFQQKNDHITRVRLKNYLLIDKFMERLMQYENVKFSMYDFNVSIDAENED